MRALLPVVGLLSSPAFACAVCGAGEDDRTQGSYLAMTIVISLLPLAMLAGIVGWVVVRYRAAAREEKAVGNSAP
ncbi:MAG: hypothetical protein ACO1OB_19480 [Archangium sp.]